MTDKYTLVDAPVVDVQKLVLADIDRAMQPVADAIDQAVLAASSTATSETPPSPRAHLRGYSAAELTARVERFRAEAADFASRAHALACAGELTPLTVEQRREQASLMQRARYRLREIRALEQRGNSDEAIAAIGIQANKLRAYGDAVDAHIAKRTATTERWATSTAAPELSVSERFERYQASRKAYEALERDERGRIALPKPSMLSRFFNWLTGGP